MADDKEEILTPEEVKANAVLADYDAQIADIQKRLDALNDPKPNPAPRPSWARQGFTPKAETEAALRKQIDSLKQQGKGEVADIAAQSQPGLQNKLYEKADAWQNKEFKTEAHEDKTLQQSKDFMGRLYERGKLAQQQKEFDRTEIKAGRDVAENKKDTTQQRSNYYAHLHYNDRDDSPAPDTDKGIQVPEPDKED